MVSWRSFTRKRTHRGSSLVYLGLSAIAFLITYGITFTLVPMILGTFFTMLPPVMNAQWAAVYAHEQNILAYIIPLVHAIGLVLFVIKVLMVAGVKGRD
jgi:ABC-type tungstate transport system substrate-binding protein